MAQRARILRRSRPSLKHVARKLVRLLDAIDELEDLKQRVQVAEAARATETPPDRRRKFTVIQGGRS